MILTNKQSNFIFSLCVLKFFVSFHLRIELNRNQLTKKNKPNKQTQSISKFIKLELELDRITQYQIKGATFPGSHDPRFCKLVIEYSKHLLKPVHKTLLTTSFQQCLQIPFCFV